MPTPQITSIHFQLTGRCNLRCIFCGQQNGMFDDRSRSRELPPEKWMEIAESLRASDPKPQIILWGGEPLLYEQFDPLARHLHESGFELGVITNGTLIDRHAELLNRCFKAIYISLDGDAPYHNRIRGNGVFERVKANIGLLKERSGRLIFLSTLADENVDSAPELPRVLGALGPDLIHLQRLMYFTRAEINAYRDWLRSEFQSDDPTIEVWHREDDSDYRRKLENALAEVRRRAAAGEYPCPVFINPHGGGEHCLAPFRRVHIKYDGRVLFCTDFYGFDAGNVLDTPLQDLFLSEKADRYRRGIVAGRNPLCAHCSWKSNRDFKLN